VRQTFPHFLSRTQLSRKKCLFWRSHKKFFWGKKLNSDFFNQSVSLITLTEQKCRCARIVRDFARIFNKSKHLGVHFHPQILHHWVVTSYFMNCYCSWIEKVTQRGSYRQTICYQKTLLCAFCMFCLKMLSSKLCLRSEKIRVLGNKDSLQGHLLTGCVFSRTVFCRYHATPFRICCLRGKQGENNLESFNLTAKRKVTKLELRSINLIKIWVWKLLF